MTELITAICSVAGTFLVLWSTVIHPRSKERKKKDREDAERQAERDQDLDGIPAIEGMTSGVPRLVVRVKRVEDELVKVSTGQALLEQRMDEANGTGKRTEELVHKIADHLGLDGK